MVGFDLALGGGALLAPDATLRVLGHAEPSDDARELFRRCAPIWLTFAAAHAVAPVRDEPADWWALAWLRGTEIATDALWSRSYAFRRPGAPRGNVVRRRVEPGDGGGLGWLGSRARGRRAVPFVEGRRGARWPRERDGRRRDVRAEYRPQRQRAPLREERGPCRLSRYPEG